MNLTKRILGFVLAGLVCLSLAACGENSAKKPTASSSKSASSEAGGSKASSSQPQSESAVPSSVAAENPSQAASSKSAAPGTASAKPAASKATSSKATSSLYIPPVPNPPTVPTSKFNSLNEYLNDPEIKSGLQQLTAEFAESGIYVDVKAAGNKLIFTYTYDEVYGTDFDKAALEANLDNMSDFFQEIAKQMHEDVNINGKAQVEVIYKAYNGEVIASRVFTEN
mgnify:CR=1 FL=1